MPTLKQLKLASSIISGFKTEILANATLTRFFPDNVPFMAMPDAITAAVIENYDDEKKCKFTYILDAEVVKQLPKSAFIIKNIHTIYNSSADVRFILLNDNPSNSWTISSLECVQAAKQNPITIVRDHNAKVYELKVDVNAEQFGVDESKIDEASELAFSPEFYIDSIDHPLIRDLVKNPSKNVVDVDGEVEKNPSTDKPESGSSKNQIFTPDEFDDDLLTLDDIDDDIDMDIPAELIQDDLSSLDALN